MSGADNNIATDPAYQAGMMAALQTNEQRRAYVMGYQLGKDADMGGGEITVPGNDILKGYEFQFRLGALDKIEGRPAATTWTKPEPPAKPTSNTALVVTGAVLATGGVLLLLMRKKNNRPSAKRWNQV